MAAPSLLLLLLHFGCFQILLVSSASKGR
jgi:hypothetical protein